MTPFVDSRNQDHGREQNFQRLASLESPEHKAPPHTQDTQNTMNAVDPDPDDPADSDEGEETRVALPFSATQKKRSDYEAFDSWLSQNRESLARGDQPASVVPVSTEDRTKESLVRSFEKAKIIESPRDYQTELFETAKQKNIIAVLDTGSGKTLIAALLLRHVVDQELQDRSEGKPARASFFLVDKVALVFQQHAVLECNLSCSVAKFFGDKTDQKWYSREFWKKALGKHMAIVCTADILLNCLMHSFVSMDQINLLIFDEAHHTKKNHAYARIIKEFYAPEAPEARPRIFGMTASPVDAHTNVAQAAQELEALLHSEIVSVSADAATLHSMAQPKSECVLSYHLAVRPPTTQLMEQIRLLVGNQKLFAKKFQFAQESLSVLGTWIVDRFWQLIFRPEELDKQEAKAEAQETLSAAGFAVASATFPDRQNVDIYNEMRLDGLDGLDGLGKQERGVQPQVVYSAHVAAVREAGRIVREHQYGEPQVHLLSNKVQRLYEKLQDHFAAAEGNTTRCIVFVDQKYTALMLADLFAHPLTRQNIPNIQPGVLTGSGTTDMGGNSLRKQLLSISKFRQGLINCLFATSVAEEGLDIPDCNLVIRFDLYRTMIQYIQSRGRARQQGSVYVHMAEVGNLEHNRLLEENKASEARMREFCQALPDDRKLAGYDVDLDFFLRREAGQQSFVVPSTKATLSYRSSLVILSRFVSSLPYPADGGSLQAEFSVFFTAKGFVSEVFLPSSSPIRHAMGRPQSRKQLAKCAAAFAMCLVLFERKYLDKHLNPVFASKLPAMRNARLAISSKKQEKYGMRSKPQLWSTLGPPRQLFATVLRLRRPDALGRPSRPLVLLTRQAIPAVPDIPLFFGPGRASLVECVYLETPMVPDADELLQLASYSLQLFSDLFSKLYKGTASDFPYLLAPCSEPTHDVPLWPASRRDARSAVDWADVRAVYGMPKIPYTGNEPDSFFADKFLSDPYDGSRKFFTHGVRRDMQPTDPVPDGVPPPKHRMWSRPSTRHDILNYSISLWSRSRSTYLFREDQPVVEAEIVTQRRNLLDDRLHEDASGSMTCYLVLDTLTISPLPVDVVAMAFNFPAIIHRLESTLIACEATRLLDLADIHPALALEAITKDCDNSGEHGESPINFQGGMGRNYERLELLGDSFLKMATSIAIFTLVPDKDEFEYHVQRMCMICNRNLFNNALDLQLEEYIRSKEFGRSWYPPTVDGKTEEDSTTASSDAAGHAAGHVYGLVLDRGKRTTQAASHTLGDKTIADVCEALIGAAYLTTYEQQDLDLAVRAVTAVVRSKKHAMQSFRDYYAAYEPPDWLKAVPATAAQTHMALTIGQQLGYKFRNPRLLRSAFTHASYPRAYENVPNYQRLEFLGDALLDMAIVDYLFHKYPDKDPQWLTEHKMAMVSNQFLAALCVTLGFHRHMLSFTGMLQKQVLEYVARVDEERQRAEADAVAAGRPPSERARDFWVHATRPPKALADLVEAYVGALFVDARYDYHGAVLPFFRRHVLPYFEDMTLYDTFASRHPVTLAANILGQRFGCRDWRVVVQETPDNEGDGCVTFATKIAAGFLVHGQVLGHGIAESGRYAKIGAAKQALKKLESLSLSAFQTMTACRCREEAAAEAEMDDGQVEPSTAV